MAEFFEIIETGSGGLAAFHNEDARVMLRELTEQPTLIFADPPFNQGEPYDGWHDKMPVTDFIRFTEEWLGLAVDALEDGGSLWVNIPDEWVSLVDSFLRESGMHRVNWCIWHYRFGQHTTERFVRSKTHALWFCKGQTYRFYDEDVRVESVRQVIGDIRAEPSGRVPMDVWGFEKFWGRVQGNNAERVPDAPNQLPEVYLERIIKACTRPGDFIVDPFCGSGTTAVVGSALGRRVATTDLSLKMVKLAMARVRRGPIRVTREQ